MAGLCASFEGIGEPWLLVLLSLFTHCSACLVFWEEGRMNVGSGDASETGLIGFDE